MSDKDSSIRRAVAISIAWAEHNEDERELENLIERHYSLRGSGRLTIEEREAIPKCWTKIQVGRKNLDEQ